MTAEVMIALDMSGSMIETDRYPATADAVTTMLDRFADGYRFGFDAYPDRFEWESCHVGDDVLFDCDYSNQAGIREWLDLNRPWKGTGDPLLLEMRQFLSSDT
jgi:hypothetical protein